MKCDFVTGVGFIWKVNNESFWIHLLILKDIPGSIDLSWKALVFDIIGTKRHIKTLKVQNYFADILNSNHLDDQLCIS
jgi:hypothetical protein